MNKTKSSHKVIAVFLTLTFFNSLLPYNMLYANNNGPNAPEASNFEPVSATDMVNLSSGDMAYVLPLLEVDGFPVTLNYHAGIPMDMEASWVGLGWNINTGAISRGVIATPDDWNIGRRLNLTFLNGTIDSYSVDVGVGLGQAAEVGIGLSWGSNKSLSGSVSATVGPISASIDTNGNYGVGLNHSVFSKGSLLKAFEGSSKGVSSGGFGGSLTISGNTNKGGVSANIGVGGSSGALTGSMGVSISGSGIGSSYSIGAKNESGSGASMSMNSFSAGDFSYNTKGVYIPINIGIFKFGFGYNRTEITLAEAYSKFAFGSLYHNQTLLYNNPESNFQGSINNVGDLHDNMFSDYQKRNVYGDVYEQTLPQSEEEFIGDYRSQIERLNFTFAGYDSYDINATGVAGSLRPIIGQNTVVFGEGYDGESIRDANRKTKIFYHNAIQNFRTTRSISNNSLQFSFDGQITEDAIVGSGNVISGSVTSNSLDKFINKGSDFRTRPRSGSYIETYTNSQIDAGNTGLLTPASLKSGNITSANSITRSTAGYTPDGIGGYKVTTPDGKTYHFAQPVYQYEQVQHNFLLFDADNLSKYNSSSKREATPYATHWLLTAITGPDFVDANGNNFADGEDYGYWVRLDHGQWSNAFAWRSPFDDREYQDFESNQVNQKTRKHYATFIDKEVEKSDPGYFQQGRKDLYYLDKIVAKNQTAYFVKDKRYDATGSEADYVYEPSQVNFDDELEGPTTDVYGKELAIYDKEYQLKLDRIIIVNKKANDLLINPETGNSLSNVFPTVNTNSYPNPLSFFYKNLSSTQRIHKLHQSKNVIDIEDLNSFDYSKASKVIYFDYDYTLAQNTPSSEIHQINPNSGRLTLNAVKTYGRGMFTGANSLADLYDYMPPYKFSYKNPNYTHKENKIVEIPNSSLGSFPWYSGHNQYKLDRANKDNWGFIGNKTDDITGDKILDNNGNPISMVDSWSLNEITTPQGSTIAINYEEDDFYIEAFGRRYWENNLSFQTSVVNGKIQITITNFFDFDSNSWTDFRNYFTLNEEVFIDLWLCHRYKKCLLCNEDPDKKIDISPNIPNYGVNVISVNQNILILESNYQNSERPDLHSDYTYSIDYGTHVYYPYPRGICPNWTNGGHDRHTLKYKLLANKVPPGTSGGGLRVKEIIVNNADDGSKFITRYDYINPETGKSSGITSFNPVKGEVFVPYQNELPGPGVMYEWVTMNAIVLNENNQEKVIGKTLYHYNTLKPVFNIFNPNINMTDDDGHSIFKATVVDKNTGVTNITAKEMKIEKDLSKIGQLISIQEFNEEDQLMQKTTNKYQSRIGELSETFSSMKSIFDYRDENNVQDLFSLQQRYIGLSTKSEKVSVLSSVETVTPIGKSEVTYSSPDPYVGTFTISTRKLSDGTTIKDEKIPAYKFYIGNISNNWNGMNAKWENVNNKNMLTQEAMSITSVLEGSSWKTLNANISTWNDTWTYRDNTGIENTESGIWRKHKNYVWKDAVNSNGTYATDIASTNSYFDWNSDSPTNTNWQKASEITRYTHWSSPIETMDINGNFASSKMADNFSRTIASGNAKYTEMYYSGAEYINAENSSYFEGEVRSSTRNTTAHTGNYSISINTGEQGFKVVMDKGTGAIPNFRDGKYKISVWVYNGFNIPDNTRIRINGSDKVFNGEKVRAGLWTQLNHYEELNSNQEIIYVTSSNGLQYFDDFRLLPISSSMNSYVYDQNSGELNYILNANNMATRYRYDKAGRLCKIYKEIETTNSKVGFRLINEYKYHYKGLVNTDCPCCDPINNLY